jgi:hypothetical protein
MPTGRRESPLTWLRAYDPDTLGSRRRAQLAAALAGCAPNWSVELHYAEDGEPAIVVMPDDPDDIVGPTLIVHNSGSAFNLDELCSDQYRRLGEDLAWGDIVRAVRIRLIWEESLPTTLH